MPWCSSGHVIAPAAIDWGWSWGGGRQVPPLLSDALHWSIVAEEGDRSPPYRGAHTAAVWRDTMIVYGGNHQNIYRNDLWLFDFRMCRAVVPSGRGHSDCPPPLSSLGAHRAPCARCVISRLFWTHAPPRWLR